MGIGNLLAPQPADCANLAWLLQKSTFTIPWTLRALPFVAFVARCVPHMYSMPADTPYGVALAVASSANVDFPGFSGDVDKTRE